MLSILLVLVCSGDVSGGPAIVQPQPPANSYATARALVLSGKTVVLHVGVPGGEYRVDSLPGVAPGVYDCYPEAGRPLMRLRSAVVETIRPVAQPIFQGLGSLPAFGGCPGGVCTTPFRR